MRGNREALQTPALDSSAGRAKKAKGRNVDMDVCGESDGLIVPRKRANKVGARALAAESAEGRRATKGERTTSVLVPDTEPGKRVTGFVALRQAVSRRAAGRQMNPR